MQEIPKDADFYKMSEVARLLRCNIRTIYTMVETGELPSVKIGRLTRIPASAIKPALTHLRKPPTAEHRPAMARKRAGD